MKSTNYTIGDFVTRLKNASMAGKKGLVVEPTKMIKEFAKALKKEGFLNEINEEKKGQLSITFARKNKRNLLTDLKIVSRPGRRVYMGVEELESIKGPFIFILSTPSGVISSKDALKKRTGGEVIAKIW